MVYARFNTPSMTDDNIRALAVPARGSLWIATDGGGLLRYQNGRFESFGPREGLTNEFVLAVLADRNGDVWAGTNRGLHRRHGETWHREATTGAGSAGRIRRRDRHGLEPVPYA